MMCRFKKSIVLAVAAVGIVFAQDVRLWQNLYPEYSGLAFGGGKFAAVSADGLIRSTDDGAGWSQFLLNDAETRRVYAVAYGWGQFMALPNGRFYLFSKDGLNWQTSAPGVTPSAWKYMVFGGSGDGGFVAINLNGEAQLYDEDEWQQSFPVDETPSHLAYGAGRFVEVGDEGIKSSSNAKGWAPSSVTAPVSVVAFNGEKFAALAKSGSSVYTSSNGTSWETASAGAPAGMADMVFGGGKFVAVGAGGKGCYSSDGSSWTSFTLNDADNFKAVKYGNNKFIALGAKGSVYTSSNGETWERKAGNSAISYKQIVYGGNKFVAVGDSGIMVSSDGSDWSRKGGAVALVGVAYGADKFVAVGGGGEIVSSPDGETWSDPDVKEAVFTSIAFGGTTFIAGGRESGKLPQLSKAVIHTSTDGQDWNDVSSDVTGWQQGQYIVSLCSGGGKFLAASSGGTKAVRTCDATGNAVGKHWSSVSNLPGEADEYEMTSAVYANDKFVVLGTKRTGESIILNSADAASWTTVTVPQNIKWMRSAAYAKGTYIAVADSGNVYAYVNNSAWNLQPKVTNRNLSTIYASGNTVLAAGAGGAMLYSSDAPISVKYAAAPKAASRVGGAMSLTRSGRAATVTLSFTPATAGVISVYSLNGRQLYKAGIAAGERGARLPERAMRNGSVIVRYSGGGRVVSQRFQVVR
jgi:hypothetical protein